MGDNENISAEASAEKIIKSIPGDKWIDKLRFSFIEAAGKIDSDICLKKWVNSKLKYLIESYVLDETQMRDLFFLMDANCDDSISWSELLAYISCHQKSAAITQMENKLRLTYHAPSVRLLPKSKKTPPCLRVRYLPYISQIISLSESVISFWNSDNCSLIRTLTDKDLFVDFCCIQSISKLAIAKKNRQIIFYDLRTQNIMDYCISSTLDTSSIHNYTADETKSAIRSCRRKTIPLYHTPTAIESDPSQPIIYVGNEEGNIEVFYVNASSTSRQDWNSSRMSVLKVHSSMITQITYLPSLSSFASSSHDGTITVWTYSLITKDFRVESVFKEKTKTPITYFIFYEKTMDFVYLTTAHCFGQWRYGTYFNTTMETNSQIVTTITLVPSDMGAPFLVAVTNDSFVSIYRMPNLEVCDNKFLGLHYSLAPPTGSVYDNRHLYLIGSFLSSWKCDHGVIENMLPHKDPLIGIAANDLFKSIFTFDRNGNVNSWSIFNGSKDFFFQSKNHDDEVTSQSIDISKRRLAIGFRSGLIRIITSNSGSVLTTIDSSQLLGACTNILFTSMFGSNRIICTSSKKVAILFEDLPGNRIRFQRSFMGHNEYITSVVTLKSTYILTIGQEKELFLWSIQHQNPVMRFRIPNDPTVSIDIPSSHDHFLLGDITGNVYVMDISNPSPISSYNAVGIRIKSSINSMVLTNDSHIVVGNSHGYVSISLFDDKHLRFSYVNRIRAHDKGIIDISCFEKYDAFITAGIDQEVKFWSIKPLKLVGQLGKNEKWVLSNPDSWFDHGIPEDQSHFKEDIVSPTSPKIEETIKSREEEDKSENLLGDKSVSAPELPIPPFTLNLAKAILGETEELTHSGRLLVKSIRASQKKQKSANIVKPLVPKLSFSDLIEQRQMENTENLVMSCRSLRPRNLHLLPK